MNKDKIQGLFLGAYLGDSLGMPVESWSRERIAETYGRITTLLAPEKKSWFSGQKKGTPTDDWQLTKSTANAMIHAKNPLDMKSQAKHHVKAFEENTNGWGKSTKYSAIRLQAGISWKKSGQPLGVGNGVAMKIAPLGAISATKQYKDKKIMKFAIDLAHMTHQTRLVASSAYIHTKAIQNCLLSKKFHIKTFVSSVHLSSTIIECMPKKFKTDTIIDKLSTKLIRLVSYDRYDIDRSIKEFGEGSCYVYNSLPFAYMFFVKDPHSIEALYNVINAGGDTDTNGSIVGSLLGSLNGTKVFPNELIESIPKEYYEEIIYLSGRFYEKFFT